ncbi:hypothetical protein [Magnetococcus sp. PR-3]|uniref:hypothetical protein n=1 Tax=Magnetococcus sp. PR-3 TaxID=3120355 RepID=UPI002FCE3084
MKKWITTAAVAALMGLMLAPAQKAEAANFYFYNDSAQNSFDRWQKQSQKRWKNHKITNRMIKRSVKRSLVQSTNNPIWRQAKVKLVRKQGAIQRVVVVLPQGY